MFGSTLWSGRKNVKNAPRPRTTRRLEVETLEARALPSISVGVTSHVLTIQGDTQNDVISISKSGANLVVNTQSGTAAAVSQNVPLAGLTSYLINTGNGNDTVKISSKVTLPGTIDGGTGNDTLTGGGGADTINCGSGNNIVNASPGKDVIHFGTGKNEFVLGKLLHSVKGLDISSSGSFSGSGSVTEDGQQIPFTITGTVTFQVTLNKDLSGTFSASGSGTGTAEGGLISVTAEFTTTGTIKDGTFDAAFKGSGTISSPLGPQPFKLDGTATGKISLATGTISGTWKGHTFSGSLNGVFPFKKLTTNIK